MDPVELAAQVAVTEGFIGTRPVTLVLTPHEKISDGTGGKKLSALPPRPPQIMRFIEAGRTGSTAGAETRPTETGEQWAQQATLLGMPDAAIAEEDTFPWDGATWKVLEVLFPNGYETRATVARYGN